jgi:hypothetical protein
MPGNGLGLYGIGDAHAAWHLDAARPWVAIGLAGKVFGPLGWVWAVHTGELPVRTFSLIAFNDLVWWMPFAAILLEGTRVARWMRSATPALCAGIHAAGAIALATWMRPGTEVVSDVAARTAYIREHSTAWRAGWLLWMAAGPSTVALYAWWGARLRSRAASAGPVIAASAVLFDYFAESLYIGWLPQDPEWVSRMGMWVSGGVANGLYVLGGVVLTCATPGPRGGFAFWTWAIWSVGGAVSIAAVLASIPALLVSTGVLFALYCPWCVVLGWRLPKS